MPPRKSTTSYAKQLERTRACITNDDPWASGTIDVPDHFLRLFYFEKENPKSAHTFMLDQSATSEELVGLANACDPASFGRGGEDVMDESYRKAGKMDTTTFASLFNLQELNILESVNRKLFSGPDAEGPITSELYKLNVYGPGSFFKAHKDTPRSNDMFGSLVIVFPTVHRGGSLSLSHKKNKFKFDSSQLVTESPTKIAYVAFFSDVKHEVLKVTSGYRVTLTYNLYYNPNPATQRIPTSIGEIMDLKNSISSLLDHPLFLPDGGILGFGLNFSYPVSGIGGRFDQLITRLKGSDELIKIACTELGLRASLQGIVSIEDYEDECGHIMISHAINTECFDMQCSLIREILNDGDGELIHTSDKDRYSGSSRNNTSKEVFWITESKKYSKYESTYTAYGNEPTQESFYADICLMISVGPAGDRTAEYNGVQLDDDEPESD